MSTRASASTHARFLANDLAETSRLANDLVRVRAAARDLASSIANASRLARDLANDLASSHKPLEREVKRVAPPAARLLTVVVRLLPAADRDRYDEEFRSELWDLAQAGAGRLRQMAYALRQLCCAALTVSALRSPRRRNAAP